MRTVHLAALAALCVVGIGIAVAGQGGAVFGDFISLPDAIAQAPMQNAIALATTQNGHASKLREKRAQLVGRPTTS